MQAIPHFQPVGTNVLDRGGADRAGNQGQVFQARPALGQRPLHEVVPVFAGPGGDIPGRFVLADQGAAGNRHVQDQTVNLGREHDIAAAAQNEARGVAQAGVCQLLGGGDFQIALCHGGQSEGVAGEQGSG